MEPRRHFDLGSPVEFNHERELARLRAALPPEAAGALEGILREYGNMLRDHHDAIFTATFEFGTVSCEYVQGRAHVTFTPPPQVAVLANGDSLPLPDVITAGGPTGNATTVPVITYDAQGRLTAVSTATISGVTPAAHATTHESGGTDVIPIDKLGAPTTTSDLDASASAHGLLRKLDGSNAKALLGDGSWGGVEVTLPANIIQDATTKAVSVTWKKYVVIADNGAGTAPTDAGDTTPALEQVATPTASPAGGSIVTTDTIALACATAGATIKYKWGTGGSYSTYSTAITAPGAGSYTLYAYATKAGMADSNVAHWDFTVTAAGTDYAFAAFALPTTPTEKQNNSVFGSWNAGMSQHEYGTASPNGDVRTYDQGSGGDGYMGKFFKFTVGKTNHYILGIVPNRDPGAGLGHGASGLYSRAGSSCWIALFSVVTSGQDYTLSNGDKIKDTGYTTLGGSSSTASNTLGQSLKGGASNPYFFFWPNAVTGTWSAGNAFTSANANIYLPAGDYYISWRGGMSTGDWDQLDSLCVWNFDASPGATDVTVAGGTCIYHSATQPVVS